LTLSQFQNRSSRVVESSFTSYQLFTPTIEERTHHYQHQLTSKRKFDTLQQLSLSLSAPQSSENNNSANNNNNNNHNTKSRVRIFSSETSKGSQTQVLAPQITALDTNDESNESDEESNERPTKRQK
jgi:hypothetical protein